ncbi:MAG: tRNA (guanosine(37)-N1)-methyltransferase TrmD [Candidatus Aminicenantes bacterium]|nr:MAG: tRNA (guanosine(37)-N1)-methyltransferase TrmD [Candidatus Aminicenantes bacterium]
MHFDILTIFPEFFETFSNTGVLGKAVEKSLIEIDVHDMRDWADNKWRQLDDEPYGGGPGMVIQAPPVIAAVRELETRADAVRTVLLSPRGRMLDQGLVEELAGEPRLLLLCGRYEGFDERVSEVLEPDEVSIGDFILGGGEVAAMVIMEAVARLVPGVVGDPGSVIEDSFSAGLLDHPSYTRPAEVDGRGVPDVLRSGNHDKIARWRLERAVEATVTRRPDMIIKNWDRYPVEVKRLIRRYAPGLDPERAS